MYYDVKNWLADIEGKRISGMSMELHRSPDRQLIHYISIIVEIHDKSYRIGTSSDGETISIDDFLPKPSDMGEYGSIILKDGLDDPCIRPLIDDVVSEAKEICQGKSIVGISIVVQGAASLYVLNYNDNLVITHKYRVIQELLSRFIDNDRD